MVPQLPVFAVKPALVQSNNSKKLRQGIVIKGDVPKNTHDSFNLKARES